MITTPSDRGTELGLRPALIFFHSAAILLCHSPRLHHAGEGSGVVHSATRIPRKRGYSIFFRGFAVGQDPQVFHLCPELLPCDPQDLGGLALVPGRCAQGLEDETLLRLEQVHLVEAPTSPSVGTLEL